MELWRRVWAAAGAVAAVGADARRGDAARDRGAWPEAVTAYRRFLQHRPRHAGLWIQLGNCAKEMGDFATAEDAYGRAVALRPRLGEAHLQRGHLFKLMGRHDEALDSYRRAAALDPRNGSARSELAAAEHEAALTAAAPFADRPPGPLLWLDLTDLLDHARVQASLGGIQRVVATLACAAPAPGAPRLVPFVAAWRRGALFALDAAPVRALLELMETGSDRASIDRAIGKVEDTRRAATPQRGDVLVMAGAFWVHPFGDAVAALRRRGVWFTLLLHDLIQIRHPDYVSAMATVVFRRQLVAGLTLATRVLAVSEHVAADTRAFLAERVAAAPPVAAVPLATEGRAHRPRPAAGERNRAVHRLLEREYVLCVSAIEPRKNHGFLLDVWEALRREMPDAPDLVLVGVWGWDSGALRARIERSGALGHWLHVLSGIGDDDLDLLYRHCLLTAFPSLAEGFGLPVGESLGHGKPCIAARTTSLPEVGGDFARYIDPADVPAAVAAFRTALEDRAGLAAWSARILSDFRPRPWADFAADFLAEAAPGAGAAAPPLAVLVPPGRMVPLGLEGIERDAHGRGPLVPLGLARGAGWHPVEDWGAWTGAERARLTLATVLPEGTPAVLFLRLRRPDYSPAEATVRIRVGEAEIRRPLGSEGVVAVTGTVGAGGVLAVEIIAGEGRRAARHCGLRALGYAASSDAAGRLDLLEGLLFGGEAG